MVIVHVLQQGLDTTQRGAGNEGGLGDLSKSFHAIFLGGSFGKVIAEHRGRWLDTSFPSAFTHPQTHSPKSSREAAWKLEAAGKFSPFRHIPML